MENGHPENIEDFAELLEMFRDAENDEDDTEVIPPSNSGIEHHLLMMQVQSFLALFKVYKSFDAEKTVHFDDAAAAFSSASGVVIQQSALAACCDMFFATPPEVEEKVEIEVGEKQVYKPCEDCQSTPTRLVDFKTASRTEQHYLCDKCEEAAKNGNGDL